MSTLQAKSGARWLLAGWLAVGMPGLRAQGTAPGTACQPVRDAGGNLVPNPNCAAGAPGAPAGQRFPYPGEVAPAGGTPASLGNLPPTPQTDAPAAQKPASKRFPYPGETDAPSAATPQIAPPAPAQGALPTSRGTPLQDAGSSGESSSSGSSSSSDSADPGNRAGTDPNDPDTNDPAAVPRKNRHKLPPVPRQSSSEREQEDVQVAGFYLNDGNFRAAYDRAREAVGLDTEDAKAQLALGDSARKLGKLDEAERAYKRCLELDPVPKVRKPAEKALREMTGG